MDEELRKDTSEIPQFLIDKSPPEIQFLLKQGHYHTKQNDSILKSIIVFKEELSQIQKRHKKEDEERISTDAYRKGLKKSMKIWTGIGTFGAAATVKLIEIMWK